MSDEPLAGSYKYGGISMDPLIAAAGRALATGDPLSALKGIALRQDAPALALRGIAMAQLGDLARARELLRGAIREFGPRNPLARARCMVADAEIALVSRDLGRTSSALNTARMALIAAGDKANAAHAGYLEARRLLLIGNLDQAEMLLNDIEAKALPRPSEVGRQLVLAGLAIRRIKAEPAKIALAQAYRIAKETGIAPLLAEVEQAGRALQAPAARLISHATERSLRLDEVETLLSSDVLIVDACRNVVRMGTTSVSLTTRPVLLTLVRTLAESWPDDAPRELLLKRAFHTRQSDESHRARLRVDIARLREALQPLATLTATQRGFALLPRAERGIAVLAPPVEDDHADLLALLADGQAWSSSALALALNISPRTVQRALEELLRQGKVERFGRGRACRWIASNVPGFPTSLLLPTAGISV